MVLSRWSKKLNLNRQAIRKRILNDPYYRFCSLEEVAIAVELGITIDVNQAGVDDWLRLPGLSIHQGRTLVELVSMGVELLCIEDLAAALSIPIQRLKPLAPILVFSYRDPQNLLTSQRININCATLEQLQDIPVIDANFAQNLINNRRENGFYKNFADLQQRLTLTGSLISELMHYLQF
ncbi:MAG: ComEA family DNA-binding protein [cyanobacterium endosymbiont of Rhopalodia musculus]|uniref:ComEA family DNA-binding protein n=1 Tax=cyanobacterium endosymbiont of Epithemia clementina EcSB TaxID=3034674 RepID=UPI00247FF0C7|nr:ComEA family DNA-binding protein [cyanobacterium endosymbiont of Epithemia clementina EcSB]WGT67509.1 ComEA family DNA-binding protein [cyanobacterium endosymbiont of Epithemia clementina EcSB]